MSDFFTNTCTSGSDTNFKDSSGSSPTNDSDNYRSTSDSTDLDSNSTQSDDENTFSTASINENDINMQFKGTKEGLSLYYTNADNLLFK